MRAFIAVSLSEEIRKNLSTVKDKWQKNYPEINWVPSQNLHLTIKFLGEITRSQFYDVIERLNIICTGCSPFLLHVSGTGAFPEKGRARIIWAGCTGGPELLNIAGEIARDIPLGDNKPFHPHITLGRAKGSLSDAGKLLSLIAKEAPEGWGTMKVDGIDVMESILRAGGPIYKKIHTIILK